jgi:hypothetical protein
MFPLYATTLRFLSVLVSTKPFGPGPFDREIRSERLTADGLDPGCQLTSEPRTLLVGSSYGVVLWGRSPKGEAPSPKGEAPNL